MPVTGCHIVCFSPTGSTRKIAEAVAAGCGFATRVTDISLWNKREKEIEIHSDELIILASPVYFGRVATHAAEAFARLDGQGVPVVLLVNYGNRAYEDSLQELFFLATQVGFTPLAAGAFVSEHSFSTAQCPLAPGRPDALDMEQANSFGVLIKKKLALGGKALTSVPGNLPFKPYPDFHRAPVTVEGCIYCGMCADICPTRAITLRGGEVLTTAQECIICQACVKICPEKVRLDIAPGAKETVEYLIPLVAERKERQLFV